MSQNSAHFQIRGKPGFIDSCVGLVPTNVLVSRDLANFLVGYAEVTSAVQNVNERSLPVSQVLRIANLGGVIGFGEVSDGENGYADPDPVAAWITKYAIAWDLMGGKGVALGTDTNGLSPLIPGDIVATIYPIQWPSQFGAPPGTLTLPQFQLGQRTPFNFQYDGIATYGLLPDFIQAAYYATATTSDAGRTPAPATVISALFNSAEDTIEMWEKVVAAEPNIPPGGQNSVATSCGVAAVGPSESGPPSVDQSIAFFTSIFDQNNQSFTAFPVNVTYSGNVPYPPGIRSVTGIDWIYYTPTVPNNYTLTANVSSAPNSFSCSVTVPIPPVLQSISSPGFDPNSWVPIANADGSTQLTLTGAGFLNAASVSFGGTSVPVTPTNDSTVLVKAPAYSGSLWQNVGVYVTSSTGLQSNTGSIQYFRANTPILNSLSAESCNGVKGFTVEALVLNPNGDLIDNAQIQFAVGGITKTVETVTPGPEADFIASFSSLSPANQRTYSGTASYNGVSTPFILTQPTFPLWESCHPGFASIVSTIGQGPIFKTLGTCKACSFNDLPDDFNNSQYYIEDLFTVGALAPFRPVNGRFYPEMPVSRATFLYALTKVLSPSLSRLVQVPIAGDKHFQTAMTRGEAANMVTHLVSVKGGAGDTQSRTEAVVRAGYLHKIEGESASEKPLTRIEMVNLVWHVARLQLAAIARQAK